MPDVKRQIIVELFGGLWIRREGAEPVEVGAHQAGAVLALLALDMRRPLTRDEIIDRLWPEDDVETARKRLRHNFHVLRRLFEDPRFELADVLVATRTAARLNAKLVRTDVQAFEEALQASTRAGDPLERARLLEEAIGAYRGALLPGFYLDCFHSARERLAGQYGSALLALTQLFEQAGDLERAIETAQKAVAHDPLMEEARIVLMRLYAAAGQPSAVYRQFQELERIFKELDEEPSSELQELVEALRRSAQENSRVGNATHPGLNENGLLPEEAPHKSAVETRAVPLPTGTGRKRPFAALVVGGAFLVILGVRWLGSYRAGRSVNGPGAAPSAATAAPGTVPVHKPLWTVRYAPAPDEVDGGAPNAMTTDSAGNIYIAGSVHSRNSDADFLTLKYDPNGRLLWNPRYNGPANEMDSASCIALDRAGSVYVAGVSGNGNDSTSSQRRDIVVIKYDKHGRPSTTWTDLGSGVGVRRYIAPNDTEAHVRKICVDDRDGSVWMLTNSFVESRTGRLNRREEWSILKYGPDGARWWVRREQAPTRNANAGAEDMTVDITGNVYVASSYQTDERFRRHLNFMISKYDRNGRPLWKRRFSDPKYGDQVARRIALDRSGNVYVAAEVNTGDTANNGRLEDIVTIKYDADGHQKWTRFYDLNNLRDWPRRLALDHAGNITIVGESGKGAGPTWSYLVLRYDTHGNLLWTSAWNGQGPFYDLYEDLALDSRGNVFVTSCLFENAPSHGHGSARYSTIKFTLDGRRLWDARYGHAGRDAGLAALTVDNRDQVVVTGTSRGFDAAITTTKYVP
jgi:DNA-binding SARP family transcriptional activator